MRKVYEVIVVEGRYDKNTVAQAVEATIIETSGFGVFSDKEKLALISKLAAKRGLIILTDSDKAGFFIRGRLRGILHGLNIKHAYIPDVEGREKRKQSFSKEGKIGVEGMTPDIIIKALERAGATFDERHAGAGADERITKTDMYAFGLSGVESSAQRRRKLLERLDLPGRLSANGLLDVLNVLYTRDEFILVVEQLIDLEEL